VVAPEWSSVAIRQWLSTGGNVRQSHRGDSPIGKGISAETDNDGATWVKSVIVEPLAQKFLRKGVLTAYSVGISYPQVKPDPTGRAIGGIIYGGTISELSLVDRPANANCGVQLVKSVGGVATYSGKTYRITKSGKLKVTKSAKVTEHERYLRQIVATSENSFEREGARQELYRMYGNVQG
jgi:hypothetical protein